MLKMGMAAGPGMRAYLAVGGGLDVGDYLGSSSTFMLGGFGGHDGRALRAGDVIHLRDPAQNRARGRDPARRRHPDLHERLADRRPVRPARGARLFPGRRHRACSSTRTGRSITSRTAPASASSAPSPSGRGSTAARPACTRPTSTTTPTPSARLTSPATCPSSWGRTAPASAASSAPSSSPTPNCGRRANCAPATPCASAP